MLAKSTLALHSQPFFSELDTIPYVSISEFEFFGFLALLLITLLGCIAVIKPVY